MRSLVPATLLVAVLAAGAGAGTGCTAAVASDPYPPDLVYVSPGVQVIADYHEPIFYSDGLYWRYYGGNWYRSRYYTGGWAYATPPAAVLRIDRPYGYARYRPYGYAARPRGSYYAPATPARGGWRAPPAAQARPAEPMRRPPAYQPTPPGSSWRAAPAPRGAPAPAPRGGPAPRSGGGGWR
jgi:hypothetical protein